ncbi:MAG: DegT/DnrJ/EryC1/StrS family aminotransferase [Cyclobacteriaceae bacterium]
MKVNFLDLKSQYLSIKPEIDEAIEKVFDKTAFAGGPFVAEFEENFAKAHRAKYCVAVNNGTSALHATLMALDIGPGDEVIVPANTFFASAEAVSLAGAKPVFVECDEKYYNIDPTKIEGAITAKTKAVFAVHLYGQPAPMDPIKAVTDKHDLMLLEDCAQAHLATYKGQFVGNFGVTGSFSFYPGKNLGAYGEGGAVITNDQALYKKLQTIKDHGSDKKYYHKVIGHNYRMSGLQGAVLNVKLEHIANWTAKRRECADLYRKYLHGIDQIILPESMPEAEHSYHLFVIRVQDREQLQQYLTENQIYTGIHYPIPCHLQEAYESLNYPVGSFPISEKYAKEILSLPMSEQLKESEVQYVAEKLKAYYS